MKRAARSDVASSFTMVKGALIEESYSFLADWDSSQTKDENLRRWKDENPVGLRTETWLRDVAFVMSRRFEPEGRDRPLQELAKSRCDLEQWNPWGQPAKLPVAGRLVTLSLTVSQTQTQIY